MEDLGQQSMLERPPQPRRLIVPAGATSWWGVDPSTRGVSLAWVGRGAKIYTHLTSGEGLERLHQSFTAGRMAAMDALNAGASPGVVVIEQPSGRVTNIELVMAVGAICAGVVSALAGRSVHFEMIGSPWWKKRACGRGDIKKSHQPPGAKKPVYLPLEDYPVMKWARLNGYTGSSWDEADALAMAEAARGEWALVER